MLARGRAVLHGRGAAKPSARAFPLPLAQVARRGARVRVWGQVRPRRGAQQYRLQVRRAARGAGPAACATNGAALRVTSPSAGAACAVVAARPLRAAARLRRRSRVATSRAGATRRPLRRTPDIPRAIAQRPGVGLVMRWHVTARAGSAIGADSSSRFTTPKRSANSGDLASPAVGSTDPCASSSRSQDSSRGRAVLPAHPGAPLSIASRRA